MSQRNNLSINVGTGDGKNVQHKSRLNVQGSHSGTKCYSGRSDWVKMSLWTFRPGIPICLVQVMDSVYFILYFVVHSAVIALFIIIVSCNVEALSFLYPHPGSYIPGILILITTTT